MAARLLNKAKRSRQVSPLMKDRRWLHIEVDQDFETLNGVGFSYLTELLGDYAPICDSRSTDFPTMDVATS